MTSSLVAGTDVVEIRVGGTKVVLSAPLTGDEDEDKRAMLFYTVNAALAANSNTIKHRARLLALGNHVRLSTVVSMLIERIDQIYDYQKWDPGHWTILSFHDEAGRKLDDAVDNRDRMTLKKVGSMTQDTLLAEMRPENVTFVLLSTFPRSTQTQ